MHRYILFSFIEPVQTRARLHALVHFIDNVIHHCVGISIFTISLVQLSSIVDLLLPFNQSIPYNREKPCREIPRKENSNKFYTCVHKPFLNCKKYRNVLYQNYVSFLLFLTY